MNLIRTLAAGLGATLLLVGAAQAGDLLLPDNSQSNVYDSQLMNFEGFYVGASLGAGNFPKDGRGGTVGVIAGANFSLTQSFLAGVEFQGDAVYGKEGFSGANALLLGKLGGYITDETLLYGTAGGGTVDSTGGYALGAGIEQALGNQVSVRGEAMGTGAWGGGFDGGKAAVGVLWHMN